MPAIQQAESRMAILKRQQEAKARNLAPAQPDRAERFLDRYVGQDPMNRYAGGVPGLHLRLGGTDSGAGFSMGLEYARRDLSEGRVAFRASGVGSIKRWYGIETELQFPRLGGRSLGLGFLGRRMSSNSIDYYGPGPDSRLSERTNYRREENTLDATLTYKPADGLNIGFAAGYQGFEVGPGASPDTLSSEQRFSPGQAPGIDRPTHYLRFGPFLEFDSRDKARDAHAGTHFLVRFSRFADRKHGRYSFRRVDGTLEQYIPFHNRKRVVALRAHAVLNYPDGGNVVPFYLQPTLGGSSDLRGYRRTRFHDNNLFLVVSEYRWEVFTLMDAAVFADAGKVFPRDGDFGAARFERDAGFGLRFKTRDAVVLRVDAARSREGLGLWFVFDHVF